jgi:hypothetical protein
MKANEHTIDSRLFFLTGPLLEAELEDQLQGLADAIAQDKHCTITFNTWTSITHHQLLALSIVLGMTRQVRGLPRPLSAMVCALCQKKGNLE